MSNIEKLIEDGYVKVGSKSYCEYWKRGEEVVTVQTDSEYSDDDQEEYFEEDEYDEEYELSEEDFAKLKSYEVSEGVYKYISIENLKEILTLRDKPYIYNLETDWDNEFHADLSKLEFDYGLICGYCYLDSWGEFVNCCIIIDGGVVNGVMG